VNKSVAFALQPKQLRAFHSQATEILYGGAAGGGKSHLMRVCAIVWSCMIPGLQVYLFRRVSEDLHRNHVQGPSGFRALLAEMVLAGYCGIVEDEIRFKNGSVIYLCHCKDEKHMYKYQGAEIHVLLIDELTHFSETIYRFLRNRVRMVKMKARVPDNMAALFPRIICGANPGNIGHMWVKRTFIDGAEPMRVRQMLAEEGQMLRQYIPAKLSDNAALMRDDPGYLGRLSGLGSPALVAAMRDGDWNQIEGAFFEIWRNDLHVVKPFVVPVNWLRFRSGDWGSAKPFSFGWWAVAQDQHIENGHVFERGDLIRYREWYGCKPNKPNEGLRLTAEEVGYKLAQIERDEKIIYGVLDPACFAHHSGPSIYENIYKGSGNKVVFQRADNTRIANRGALAGWDQMRARLKGDCDAEGNVVRPAIYCFSNCLDSIRTIPALQHDMRHPEDLDSDMEDHAADDWRYACNSRPYVPPSANTAKPVYIEELSIDAAWEYSRRDRDD
jgi:Terminase large subunit, T4likevirus-type, N-terminal